MEEALKEKGWSRADLAREVGCSRSVITALLNRVVNQSPYVPDIHDVLGWTPPQSPLPTTDTAELMRIWQHLSERGRARLIERGHAIAESEPDPKKKS